MEKTQTRSGGSGIMAPSKIYVTLVRPGKSPQTVEVDAGSTVRATLDAAGIPSNEYGGWNLTDEDGDTLSLDSRLESSTSLICGMRVDGAH
jgi:hypothetical protein